jgi:hypothetical protein
MSKPFGGGIFKKLRFSEQNLHTFCYNIGLYSNYVLIIRSGMSEVV